MLHKETLLVTLYAGAALGFIAGKNDLDVKIRHALDTRRRAIAHDNASIFADVLEQRKLGVPVASSQG